jgi:DNA-binding MarR family transcriptional regulator
MAQSPTKPVSFGYLLNDVTRHMRRQFDRRATRFDLTRAQWRALKTVAHHEGMSQTMLAELIEMEPIPVGRLIDRLQQAGFVERRADPDDRRCWRLHSTEKARAVVDDMEVVAAELRLEAQRGISRSDMDTFIKVLNHIKNNLTALDGADRKASQS